MESRLQLPKKPKAKIVKKKVMKKAPAKKAVVRKTAPATAADKIFAIIKRSKGVNIETLMNKTGY